jgi:hypothetical protein
MTQYIIISMQLRVEMKQKKIYKKSEKQWKGEKNEQLRELFKLCRWCEQQHLWINYVFYLGTRHRGWIHAEDIRIGECL